MSKRQFSIALFITLAIVLLLMSTTLPQVTYAANGVKSAPSFDNTDILAELTSSKDLDGDTYNANKYAINPNGNVKMYSFAEYGLSDQLGCNQNFALYLYIYNPSGLKIASTGNKVTLSTEWTDEVDVNGYKNVSRFSTFDIKICSKLVNNSIYKFKVVDRDGIILNTAFENQAKRQYDFGKIDLVFEDGSFDAFNLGVSFVCQGYAKGLSAGSLNASTLTVASQNLETLHLKVHDTFYRLENLNSDESGDINRQSRDTLHTVYFNVPNVVLQNSGNLQKIHCEWDEYKTTRGLVTSNRGLYDLLYTKLGQKLTITNKKVTLGGNHLVDPNFECGYFPYNWNSTAMPFQPYAHFLSMLFYTGDYDDSVPFAEDFTLSGEDVLKYLVNYSLEHDFVDLSNYKYNYENDNCYLPESEIIEIEYEGQKVRLNPNLFLGYVDDGRTMGHNDVEIEATDKRNLIGYEDVSNAWQAFWGDRHYQLVNNFSINSIEPIQQQDLILPKVAFCNKYFINPNDYDELMSSMETGKTTYLFRYAVTEYSALSHEVYAPSVAPGNNKRLDKKESYDFTETVFFNFNIIDVTFQKDNVYTTMPVVANPINIVADAEPAIEDLSWQQILKRDTQDFWDKIVEWFKNIAEKLKIAGIVIGCIAVFALFLSILISIKRKRPRAAQSPPINQNKTKTKSKTKKQTHRR